MHNFVVHSNESACRKSGRLRLEQVLLLMAVWLLTIVPVLLHLTVWEDY